MLRDGHKTGNGDGSTTDNPFTQKNVVFTTLLVENIVEFQKSLENFLKSEGHYLLLAENAAETLALIRQHWPDLILLTKEMDGSNGLKFLPELLLTHPSAAVVVMANHPRICDAVDAMRLGAVDYMERPVDLTRLKETIDTQKALFEVMWRE